MNEKYDFEAIEKKWQLRWASEFTFRARESSRLEKFYVLEMLPYPSGALHMGHVRNYSLGDSVARLRGLQGYEVLHPIGWDAFGLPAENAALKHRVHPGKWTLDNIQHMKMQCKRMGWGYDWEREIASCLPDYYRWNQWLFLKMHEKGLAYKKKGKVNWCEECQTVLANEQVENGLCWRDGSQVVDRELSQWYLKITDYADQLVECLEELGEWPDKVVTMQRNWVGRSFGAELTFRVADSSQTIDVFTTRVDTIFGATFVVLAPEHPLVEGWSQDPIFGPDVRRFREEIREQTREARIDEAGEKRGVFTGKFATNPYSQEEVPIWVADFVLMEYGTGAIMAVPAHDQRDFEFASKYGLPIRPVIRPESEDLPDSLEAAVPAYGTLIHSGEFTGLTSQRALELMSEVAVEQGFGKKKTSYRLRDWGISRQRYWGTPIPMLNCPECGLVPVPESDLPVILPPVDKVHLGEGSPLAQVEEFVQTTCPSCGGPARRETDTMDTFVDSAWYFYRYCDAKNQQAPFEPAKVRHWMPVDIYIGGIEHAVLHLIYMRFFSKVMRDLKLIDFDEPVTRLFTQGMVTKDGAKMSKSRGNVVSPDAAVGRTGADALRLFIQFCAPPDGELEWSEQGLEGCFRFLRRTWRILYRLKTEFDYGAIPEPEQVPAIERSLLRTLHQTIRKVGQDIDRMRQNTAIAAIMTLLNEVSAYLDSEWARAELIHEVLETMAQLLAPFTPHFSEEMWELLGHTQPISSWPEFKPEMAREEEVQIVVQINGKVRSRFAASPEVGRAEMERRALDDDKIQEMLDGKTIRKVIVVPQKLVNIVVS